MKNWGISAIENITEEEVRAMAIEMTEIKGHTIYFVDFENYFGYSCIVFKNNHGIYHANDYELHHHGKSRAELRELYIKKMNGKLFTEEEIAEPLKSYDEYRRKADYLCNYYGMQVDYVSIFHIKTTEKEEEERKEKIKTMVYNPVALAYMNDVNFVDRHIELLDKLEKARMDCINDYEYQKAAFLDEMYNHEYGINWQADYDTLSAFGNIRWHDDDLNAYFEELKFTELQKKAYLDARRQYFKKLTHFEDV